MHKTVAIRRNNLIQFVLIETWKKNVIKSKVSHQQAKHFFSESPLLNYVRALRHEKMGQIKTNMETL